jgi:ADP-ribose pyrophosphatase YjhB (NUDIX family)
MTLTNNDPCPHCGRFANRGVTIDAIILKDGQVLLIKRGVEPFKGYWALPGGYVGWDETIADAVKREVNEELGVSVKGVKELKTYSNPNRHPKQCIDIPHYVEIEGEPKVGDDAVDFRYFPLTDLPSDMAFDHRQLLQDYLLDKEK